MSSNVTCKLKPALGPFKEMYNRVKEAVGVTQDVRSPHVDELQVRSFTRPCMQMCASHASWSMIIQNLRFRALRGAGALCDHTLLDQSRCINEGCMSARVPGTLDRHYGHVRAHVVSFSSSRQHASLASQCACVYISTRKRTAVE